MGDLLATIDDLHERYRSLYDFLDALPGSDEGDLLLAKNRLTEAANLAHAGVNPNGGLGKRFLISGLKGCDALRITISSNKTCGRTNEDILRRGETAGYFLMEGEVITLTLRDDAKSGPAGLDADGNRVEGSGNG